MTIYTVALLVRTVADGLGAVPDDVAQAATAMGYGRGKRFFAVELPLAVPVIAAGLRVAAVSNVSIVSVGAIIGVQQLGLLFTDGFNRFFYDPIVVGIARLRPAGPALRRRHRRRHQAAHALAARHGRPAA